MSVPEILAELGEPEAYAQTFLPDRDPAPHRRLGSLNGIARLAGGSLKTLPLLIFVLTCYSVAIFALFVALLEITEPATTGFYMELDGPQRNVYFTISGPLIPEPKPDLLGAWLAPIMLVIAGLIHLAMSALLRRIGPRDRGARDSTGPRTAPSD